MEKPSGRRMVSDDAYRPQRWGDALFALRNEMCARNLYSASLLQTCVNCSCRLPLLAAGAGRVVFCCCSRSADARGHDNERATVSRLQVVPTLHPCHNRGWSDLTVAFWIIAIFKKKKSPQINPEVLLCRIQFCSSSDLPQSKFQMWPLGKSNCTPLSC